MYPVVTCYKAGQRRERCDIERIKESHEGHAGIIMNNRVLSVTHARAYDENVRFGPPTIDATLV